ncbi:MAG: endolytic transglycosylase MltG [Acidimicrobiales bacterium]|nr:endolytic transglycosylase MltG [Acidimicrobiales bacterium]HMS89030.1 endolytic transglycosylase MltG [Acidimicrobiales bacterium]
MTDPLDPAGPAAPPRRPLSGAGGADHEHDDHDEHDEHDDHDDHDDHDIWDDEAWDDDHDDDHGWHPAGRRRLFVALGAVALVLCLLAGVTWVWYGRQVNPPGGPGERVAVEVPTGVSVRGIGAILEDRGVISNASVFNFYAGRRGAGPFQAGVYELRQNSDFDLVLDTLAAGPSEPVLAEPADTVSIPEGLTVGRILDRLVEGVADTDRTELQAALDAGEIESSLRPADQPSYEGLLFPATYEVGEGVTGLTLLQDMAIEMEDRLERLDVDAARARLAEQWGLELTDYDFLKVASMVQAEAGNVEEAPQIATVIYNRLAQGMPLGIDAVDRYGAELAGTEVDFTDGDLPYNTRRRPGLPPTPIAAPGEFALEAALVPADGDWLYYVLQEERSHVFVVTNAEFLEAKRICRERDLGCG